MWPTIHLKNSLYPWNSLQKDNRSRKKTRGNVLWKKGPKHVIYWPRFFGYPVQRWWMVMNEIWLPSNFWSDITHHFFCSQPRATTLNFLGHQMQQHWTHKHEKTLHATSRPNFTRGCAWGKHLSRLKLQKESAIIILCNTFYRGYKKP